MPKIYFDVAYDWLDHSSYWLDPSPYRKKGSKGNKKMCSVCDKRYAVYYSNRSKKRNAKKRVRAGKFHTLCIQCYGKELDRLRGEREKERELKEERKQTMLLNKEKAKEDKHDKDDAKCDHKRARRRWDKTKTLSRVAGRRIKESVSLLNVGNCRGK